MNLIPWKRHRDEVPVRYRDSSDPFAVMHQQMDRLFDAFFHEGWPTEPPYSNPVLPSVEVSETDTAVTVSAELPGMEEKDIDVRIDQNLLTLKGEKREETESKNGGWTERRYGRFDRLIPLPDGLKADEAKAVFRKGVLRIEIPKDPEQREGARRIDIQVE